MKNRPVRQSEELLFMTCYRGGACFDQFYLPGLGNASYSCASDHASFWLNSLQHNAHLDGDGRGMYLLLLAVHSHTGRVLPASKKGPGHALAEATEEDETLRHVVARR